MSHRAKISGARAPPAAQSRRLCQEPIHCLESRFRLTRAWGLYKSIALLQ